MTSLDDITGAIRDGLAGSAGLDRTIKFDLKQDGVIFVDGPTVTNDDAPADCTLVVAIDDLVALAEGRLDPVMAMMRGRLKVKGDMGLAMRLPSLLADARRAQGQV
jgi:putative sterol carrier protein